MMPRKVTVKIMDAEIKINEKGQKYIPVLLVLSRVPFKAGVLN